MAHNPIIACLVFTFLCILVWYLKSENRSSKDDNVKVGVGCLGILGIFFFFQFIDKFDRESLDKNGLETIGQIIGFTGNNTIKWVYTTKEGKKVKVVNNSSFIGLQIGEQFKAIYDESDLKNAKIELSKPILDFQKVDTLYNNEFKNSRIEKDHIYVTFTYKYGNSEYQRQQKLPHNEKWENIDSFILLVNKNNPMISYLKPR